MTLQSLLQQEVNRLVRNEYSEDDCPPTFIVSIYEQNLILTCTHAGYSFSEKVFPQVDMTYGIAEIKDIMTGLYNRTM